MKTTSLKEFRELLSNINFEKQNILYISIKNEKLVIPNVIEFHKQWASWTINKAIEEIRWSDWKRYRTCHILYHSNTKGIDFINIIKYLLNNLTIHTSWNNYTIEFK